MPRFSRLQVVAFAFYALLAYILLNPLITHSGTQVAGFDYFNYNWNFWWTRHALTTPGLSIYQSNFVFFPTDNNLGYHALTLFWYPLWAVVEPLLGSLTAINLIIYLGCLLNGYLLFVLLVDEGVKPGIALIGGAALQTLPIARYFYYNTHLNLMDWFWLPAFLLLWKQIAKAAAARHLPRLLAWSLVTALAVWGVGLTDLQFPIFTGFVIVPYGLLTLWRARRDRPRLIRLIGAGLLAVGVGAALLWFAGPLPHMLTFTGTLAPGPAEERPGIPFPQGFLTMHERWWNWDTPSTGAFVTLVTLLALVVALRQRKHIPDRWFWFFVALPPLILAMGPTLWIGELEIPLPFRLMHGLTDGMFRMPWRLAPIFVVAAMLFAGKTLSAWPPLVRPGARRVAALTAAFLLLAISIRLFETRPLDPVAPDYAFYHAIGAEQGEPYDDYVVLEVPTGAGTGEALLGLERAIQLQYYGMIHEKRGVNGFVSRAPTETIWPIYIADPLMAWLGQRAPLDAAAVEPPLRERIFEWPIGYVVIHLDLIESHGPTQQELIGYFNQLDDLLCPYTIEGDAVVYRTRWHPDGCPPRTPPQDGDGAYVVDVGSPDDLRYIGWGWHRPEAIFDVTLRWAGEYPQADVYVDLPPGGYALTVTAQAFWEPRELRLLVNDQPVGEPVTVIVDGLQNFSFAIPADLIGDGQHVRVALLYDGVLVPVEIGQSADERRLSVAVDRLRFQPLD